MTKTIDNQRTSRVQGTTGVTGSEALSVENAGLPSQEISAATEEQTSIGAFKDHQLQSLSLLCDQDVDVQFLGIRYPVVSTTAAAVFPGVLHAVGDLEDMIFGGDLIRVEGTVADDGIYLVETVVFGADTTITLANGEQFPGAGGGAVGTIARVCSQQHLSYQYNDGAVVAATGTITVLGDVSNIFAAGDFMIISGSTGNDGIWPIASVTTDGPPVTTTTFVVTDRLGANTLPNAVADGQIHKAHPAFQLAANVPLLWSIDGGTRNPFLPLNPNAGLLATDFTYLDDRGDVAFCMVDNTGNAVAANFSGVIGTDAIIF